MAKEKSTDTAAVDAVTAPVDAAPAPAPEAAPARPAESTTVSNPAVLNARPPELPKKDKVNGISRTNN
jgi:hypothetical protein